MRKTDFEENFLIIEGIRMHYLMCGKGRPLLLLHGGGLRALSYERNITLLAEKYRVIAPDIPGFGGSDMPEKFWNFDDFADFFVRFLEVLDVKDCILVGHSFGGGIALHLAPKSERISRLVLIDSAGIPPLYSPTRFFFLLGKKTFRGFFFFGNKKTSFVILLDFFRGIFRRFFSIRKMWKMTMHALSSKSDPYECISQPTYILWGESDELFSRTHAEEFSRRIKNSEIQYVEGNHDWILLFPGKFLELMRKEI